MHHVPPTVQVRRRRRVVRAAAPLFLFQTSKTRLHSLLGWDQTQPDYPVAKIAAVSLILLLAIVATIVLLNTYYSYIEPCDARYNKDGSNATDDCPANLRAAPCNGLCEGCVDDPDCKAWTEFLMAQEGMTNICPPPNDDCKIVILSRFVALSVSLILKASLLQAQSHARSPIRSSSHRWAARTFS